MSSKLFSDGVLVVYSRRRRPKSLAEVASEGDFVATLRSLRDRLATEIDSCDRPRDVGLLAARLSDVLAQIHAVESDKDASIRDELARKRAERQRRAAGAD